MEETQKIFAPTPVARPIEGEETLVNVSDASLSTPRFDEVEAQVARPVVPLKGNFAGRGSSGGSGVVVRRRQWPIALVLISALAGGVVSLLAFRLYQQRQQSQVAATQADTQTAETDATPTTTEGNTPLAQPAPTETGAQSESPVVFEEFDPAKESLATGGSGGGGNAKPARATATEADAKPATAGRGERREETKPAPRAAEPKPRLVETIPAPRQVEARGENVSRDERRNDDDAFEDRRERRRERRESRHEGRRRRGRNIDRIKDIFEGPPPA